MKIRYPFGKEKENCYDHKQPIKSSAVGNNLNNHGTKGIPDQ